MDGDARVTLSDEAMGSKDYIAPEMESGRHGPVTGAVDVYALGKVLYWMLSGGRIFAREEHRANNLYLPHLLGEQRWEHVHGLLDGMVVQDPAARIPIQLLRIRMEETLLRVEGNYTPLRPSLGLICRFCGIGRYVKHGLHGGFTEAFQIQDPRALRCPHCGHMEIFDSRQLADPGWWDR